MLRPYGMLLRQDGAEEESQKSRPSQRTLGESPRDSQDGPGAKKSGLASSIEMHSAGETAQRQVQRQKV